MWHRLTWVSNPTPKDENFVTRVEFQNYVKNSIFFFFFNICIHQDYVSFIVFIQYYKKNVQLKSLFVMLLTKSIKLSRRIRIMHYLRFKSRFYNLDIVS